MGAFAQFQGIHGPTRQVIAPLMETEALALAMPMPTVDEQGASAVALPPGLGFLSARAPDSSDATPSLIPNPLIQPVGASHQTCDDTSASDGANQTSDETLMRQHLRSGDRESALSLLSRSSTVSTRMMNMAFTALIETGAAVDAAADEICSLCARHSVRPSAEIFHNILGALSRSGAPPTTLSHWLNRMCVSGVPLDVWACNLLLKSHLQAQDFEAAARLLGGMLASSSAAASAPPPRPSDLPLPSSRLMAVKLSAACEENRPPSRSDSVGSGTSDMTELPPASPSSPRLGVHPASPRMATGGAPASWHHAAGEITVERSPVDASSADASAANEYAANMSGGGPEADRLPMPDACSFNMVITALGHAHRPQQAESLLWTMQQKGFVPNATSFTAVIGAYAKARQPPDASRVLERMLESGVAPDAVAVNTVLSAYAHAADVDGCRRMLREFESISRMGSSCNGSGPRGGSVGGGSVGGGSGGSGAGQPLVDLISYNTLLLACANACKPEAAESAFLELTNRGLSASQVSYATVLAAYARAGNVDGAQRWLDRMLGAGISPDAVSFNTVCSAHARVGDAGAARRCQRAMEAAGVEVTPTTHAILIHAHVQSGELDRAEHSLASLLASGDPISAASFNTLITARGKMRRPDLAEATFRLMGGARVEPTLVTFNALANAYAVVGDIEAVEGVVARIAAAGMRADRYTYGALLQACAAGGNAGTPGSRAHARQRAQFHVERLLRSAVPLNDYLAKACRRAVGEAGFASALRARDEGREAAGAPLAAREAGRPIGGRAQDRNRYRSAMQEAEDVPMEEEEDEEGEGEGKGEGEGMGGGWQVARASRGRSRTIGNKRSDRDSRERATPSPTSSPIKKGTHAHWRRQERYAAVQPRRPQPLRVTPTVRVEDGGTAEAGAAEAGIAELRTADGSLKVAGVPLRRSAGPMTGSQLALSLGAMAW